LRDQVAATLRTAAKLGGNGAGALPINGSVIADKRGYLSL
jgi:hypothetical protein